MRWNAWAGSRWTRSATTTSTSQSNRCCSDGPGRKMSGDRIPIALRCRKLVLPARPRGRRNVTEQAATAAIEQRCRMLRLPTIRDRFTEIAAAEREQMTYLGFCPSW
jgi:hypothetical protein